MRRPAFLEGVEVSKSPRPVTALGARREVMRAVSWAVQKPVQEPVVVAETPPAPAPEIKVVAPVEVPVPVAPVTSPLPDPLPHWAEGKLVAALGALQHEAETYANTVTHDAVELGLLIARKILEIEISTGPETLRSLVASAIRRAGEESVTRVRLHPDDVERVKLASKPGYEIVGDASLQPGDVLVETAHHTIDGRVASRFEEIVRQLQGSLG